MPFVWIYGKCKRDDTIVENNHHSYQSTYSNPRIIEDDTVSGRQYIPTSMSDAALRRGMQESRNQYESDMLFQLQLEETLRASRAQQNNNSTNIINMNIETINISTQRPTTASSTAATIGSPKLATHRPSSGLWRPGTTTRPSNLSPTEPSSAPADGHTQEGFILQDRSFDQFNTENILKTFQDLSNMCRRYSTITMFSQRSLRTFGLYGLFGSTFNCANQRR